MQGYNCQAAVDGESQIIVAADITQETNDKKQAALMLEQVIANSGAAPKNVLMDSGYFSEENMGKLDNPGMEVFMPPDRQQAGVSRELFYRLMSRVRAAALKALEAKLPGPKTVSQPSEKELLKIRERLERQEQELAKLRKALTYEKLVVKTAQRIIRRNAWGPFPGSDAKKKDMRP